MPAQSGLYARLKHARTHLDLVRKRSNHFMVQGIQSLWAIEAVYPSCAFRAVHDGWLPLAFSCRLKTNTHLGRLCSCALLARTHPA